MKKLFFIIAYITFTCFVHGNDKSSSETDKQIEFEKALDKIYDLDKAKKYAEAEKLTKELLKTIPSNQNNSDTTFSHLYLLLGRCQVSQRKAESLEPLKKSLYYYLKIKGEKEQFFDNHITYDLYMLLSTAYSWNKQYKQSLKYAKMTYDEVMRKHPSNISALIKAKITLAYAYHKLKDKKKAVKYAKETLELMKKNPKSHSRLHLVENAIKEWSK